jgi:hypothetical protein
VKALFYLEGTFLWNQLREIVRSPGRLALWAFYALGLLAIALGRAYDAHVNPPPEVTHISIGALFTAFGAAFLAMIGGAAVYHALGSVIAFRSSAEPVLLANTGISSEETVRFLQLRKLLAPVTRFLWTIVLNFLVLTPPQASRGQIGRVFLASILLAAIISTLELPMFLLGRRGFKWPIVIGGSLTALLGTFFVFAGLVRLMHVDIVPSALKPLDPGRFVAAIMNGGGGALWTLALAVAILMGLAFALGSDVLPELYSVATKTFEKFERARNATHGAEFVDKAVASTRIPAGAMALLWKSWIGFKRQRGAVLWLLVMCAISGGVGLALAILGHYGSSPVEIWETMATLIALAALVPVFVVVTVADDLAKPIWWMATPSLFWRLAALTLGRSWRSALVVGTGPCVLALLGGDPNAALFVYPAALALWWALNASALAIYSAFPSRLDFRGPLFIFRISATILIASPMLGTFIITIERTGSIASALAVSSATAGLTGLPAIGFATWRLRYLGVASSLLERAA